MEKGQPEGYRKEAEVGIQLQCTFLLQTAILNLVTLEYWGKEKLAEGVGVHHLSPSTLPQHQLSTTQASNYNPKWQH